MTERERLADRLKALAAVNAHSFPGLGAHATAVYLTVAGYAAGRNKREARAAALLALADTLLMVRDHVNLMLADGIDPTRRQRLPTVKL